MRILHIVHQYVPDYVGGTEVYCQTLAQAQSRRGDEVAVFAPAPKQGSGQFEMSAENEVDVYRISVGRRGSTAVFRSTFGNDSLMSALAEVLNQFRPDIVHIQHLMGLPTAVIGLLAERRIPFVMALHDYWYGCANGQLLTNDTHRICAGPDQAANNCARCALARAGVSGVGWVAPVVAPIMRRRNALLEEAMSAAASVIAPNEFVRSTYAALGLPVGHMTVVPWGMDLPPDLPAIRRAAVLERSQRADPVLRVGYIGSLSPQKGIHVLLDAFNKLPPKGFTLDIYGNPAVFPAYVADVRRLADHPGIRFCGLLARADFWPRLAALDVLVLPTLWYEASPLTIDEAFAAGTIVVGSDIGALPVMIRDGQDGLLFLPGDVAGLSHHLRALHEDPMLLAALRDNIRPVKTMDEHAVEIALEYDRVLAGAMA